MTSNTNMVSASTKEAYSAIHKRLVNQTRTSLGADAKTAMSPTEVVGFLIGRKSQLAKRSWHLYRSAMRFCLLNELSTSSSLDETLKIEKAVEMLNSESSIGALKRGTSTSSLKAKSITDEDLEQLKRHLQAAANLGDQMAMKAFAYITAAACTGLRPCEWAGAKMTNQEGGQKFLSVKNAKSTNGRGNGQQRTLAIDGLTELELRAVHAMCCIAAHYSEQPGGYPAWQSNLRHYFRRASRAALGPHGKYPSLYTFRHVFSARAKANYAQDEVAALMGHASAATAGRSYARARRTGGSIGVAPTAAEVQTVRTPPNSRHPSCRTSFKPSINSS